FILGGHDRATAILPAAYRYIRIDINTDFRIDKLLVTGERPEEEPHTSAPAAIRRRDSISIPGSCGAAPSSSAR
ncbi:MAG: hypothetical protein IJL72_08005, partial [Lachnospiraceae bacterium]|nr:hypothetical protein [Lachnospiraceae bacterium]